MFYGDDTFSCLMFWGIKCAEMKKWLTRFPRLTIECSREGCNWTSRNDNMAVHKGARMKQSQVLTSSFWTDIIRNLWKSRKKAEQTKSANLFDQPNFEITTLLPPKLERQTRGCRESQLPRAEAEEQEHPLAPVPGWENSHCRSWEWTSRGVKNYEGPQWWEVGGAILLWALLPGALPGSHGEDWRKMSSWF